MALPVAPLLLMTLQLLLLLPLRLPQAPCTQWQHPNGVHPERLSHGIMQHGLLLLLHHVQLLLALHVEMPHAAVAWLQLNAWGPGPCKPCAQEQHMLDAGQHHLVD